MSNLDRVLQEIVKVRGPLKKGGAQDKTDYLQVWDAFNRYLTVTHQKRQTLNVHNFCKIGWKIEELNGKARLRPHFQLADSFMRVFNLEAKSHSIIADKHFTSVEEFNYSKAAIRYSQSLTKDNIFMGLRAIVHQIGESAAHDQLVIDFEIGKLLVKDRDVQFVFMAELYLQEGLEVPDDALDATEYVPSVSFGPPSKDALSLSLQGKSHVSQSVKANSFGGWEDVEPLSPRSIMTNDTQPSKLALSAIGSADATHVPAQDMTRHLAHVEALGRHISQMEGDAAKAITEKHLWEGHLERCNGLEQKDVEWKRAVAKDHADQLKIQMRQDDAKRAQDQDNFLTKVSMHDFPCFKEAHDQDVRGYLHERRDNLKRDLEQQVESRSRMQQVQKKREMELELNNIEAGQYEIQKIKNAELSKKQQERAILAQAWDQDVRLKTVKKAIDDHHRTPRPKAILNDLISNVSGSVRESNTPMIMPTTPRLETPGALSDRGSVASSRMSTARRRPIGAAGSLSLQKEKEKLIAKEKQMPNPARVPARRYLG